MKRKSFVISFVQVYFGIFIGSTVLLLNCSNDDNNPTVTESSIPELTTAAISTITSSIANCGGTITSNGGETVTACGVCWSTSQSPTVSDNKTNDWVGAGNFISKISGLTPETEYYVRAYATNSVGTGYGSAVSFTTFETGKGTVTDIDGNLYQVIKIGNQWWMAENLKVTHYRNGETIPNVTDKTEWSTIITGAHCNYGNNSSYVTTYGCLYNWYAVNDSRNISPEGWHIPKLSEFQTLSDAVGGDGNALKAIGQGTGGGAGTNTSGFSALLAGGRYDGGFYNLGYGAYFWSSTEYVASYAYYLSLSTFDSGVYLYYVYVGYSGFSVRCLKD
jgi:uncharacterized protein (TIGR02145 family)